MKLSPFNQMAATLTAPPPAAPAMVRPAGMTRVAAMRQLMLQGSQGSTQLAKVAGVRTQDVQALLKCDLARGIVRKYRVGDSMYYELVSEHQLKLVEQLREAKALLLKHGYKVIEPELAGEGS